MLPKLAVCASPIGAPLGSWTGPAHISGGRLGVRVRGMVAVTRTACGARRRARLGHSPMARAGRRGQVLSERRAQVLDVSAESKSWRAAKGLECASHECYPPALRSTLELKQSFQQIHGFG